MNNKKQKTIKPRIKSETSSKSEDSPSQTPTSPKRKQSKTPSPQTTTTLPQKIQKEEQEEEQLKHKEKNEQSQEEQLEQSVQKEDQDQKQQSVQEDQDQKQQSDHKEDQDQKPDQDQVLQQPAKRRPGRPRKYAPQDPSKQKKAINNDPKRFEYTQGEGSTTTNGMNSINQLNYDKILDEKGEKKITKDGILLGGRKFKVPVFQLPSDNTWYMLSMDAAKVLGFRDSYLFFLRNPSLQRVFATEEEREFLIKIGILPAAYRSRNITLVSARSTYRLFGSRVIHNGKRKKDDYFESNLRYDDDLSDKGNDSETENANNILSKKFNNKITKPRNLANEASWMYQSALHARDYNTRLKIHRKDKPKFYDAHINTELVPQATQPTRIKVETISKPVFLPLNSNHSPKIPKIKFEPTPFNPLKNLSPEILEVVPPEICKIIDDMNKNIKDDCIDDEQDKYPIALMDHQFQSSYPLHRARFGHEIPEALTKNFNELNSNTSLLQKSPSVQFPLSKTNFTLSSPTITAPETPEIPAISTIADISTITDTSTIAATSVLASQSIPQLPENVCAMCFSTTSPDNTIPINDAPCSNEYTTKCSHCNRNYHPLCLGLTTTRLIVAMESYPWQCNDCKTCVVCRTSGDEATLLICDDCDRGWHINCSEPKVNEVPQGPWLCSICAQCNSCGEKAKLLDNAAKDYLHLEATSGQPSSNYPIYLATICNKCSLNFKADRFCPMCLKTFSEEGAMEENEDEDRDMVCCDECDRWIHVRCDLEITPNRYEELQENPSAGYKCPLCEGRIKELKYGDQKERDALAGNPVAKPVAQVAGRKLIRGIVEFKGKRVVVPEICGWGKLAM